jgi:SAM-dependent methyltransferase
LRAQPFGEDRLGPPLEEQPIVSQFDLASLAPTLEQREPGLWFAGQNRKAISYPAHGNAACLAVEDRSFWFRHRNRIIVELVSRFHRPGVFLDIGGGNGYVAMALISAGIQCALIEPGLDGARAARARGVDPVICAPLEDADLPSGCAASAGLFDVLEHIEHEAAALKLIHSVLEPSGYLFLTVPAYQFLYSSEDDEAGHFRRYTIGALRRILANNNFRVEFASYIFTPLPPLIFFARTIPARLGMRREHETEIDAVSEHTPSGPAAWMMDRMLDFELRRLRTGKSSPFGGSCLCVAAKE